MIARFTLILVGLLMAGLVGSFFLYVSALALLTSIAVMIGLVATLALGFWAGLNSSNQYPARPGKARSFQVINSPGEATILQ